MEKIGIICEYNPFHNGHIYHLNKIKEMFPNGIIILIMSGNFTERGNISLINKWDKTKIALNYGVDLVVELPFPFATESADSFAKGSIALLKELKVDYLIFGSECNDNKIFEVLANTLLYNKDFDKLVKEYLDLGYNYPSSTSKALYQLTNYNLNSPNDLLGLSYTKEIIKQNANIKPITIKRTNNYHSNNLDNEIVSATAIRKAINDNENIANYVPKETMLAIKNKNYQENYFYLLKYKIISEIDNLDKYLDVTEGIDKRIKKYIITSNNYLELLENVKTKRYTYNRLQRMFLHILTGYTKEKANSFKEISYIRILGFNKIGQAYIKHLKKDTCLPIITKYSDLNDNMLNYELRISFIYSEIMKDNDLKKIELKSIPIKNN